VNGSRFGNEGKDGPTRNPGHAVFIRLYDPLLFWCALFPKARGWDDEPGRCATHGALFGVSRVEDTAGFVGWVTPLLDALNDRVRDR